MRGVANPLEEGIKKLNEGDLPSAVLLFEAEVSEFSPSLALSLSPSLPLSWPFFSFSILPLPSSLSCHSSANPLPPSPSPFLAGSTKSTECESNDNPLDFS